MHSSPSSNLQADVSAPVFDPHPAQPSGATQITPIEIGKAVDRELSGGQEHSYKITLAQGQYASVIVEQRGIVVVVRLLGMEGQFLAAFDNEYRSQGEEKVETTRRVG